MNKSLNQGRVKIETYANQRWRASVENETTIENILDPIFWAHIAGQLIPGDHIECLWDDKSRWADLIVLSTGTGLAHVDLLATKELSAPVSYEEANTKPKPAKSKLPAAATA